MRVSPAVWLVFFLALPVLAQETNGPINPKAQKTFRAGLEWQQHHLLTSAMDSFKKADKQDGGHCVACARKIAELGQELGDFKSAEAAWAQLIADDKTAKDLALDHYGHGSMLLTEGLQRHEPECFRQSDVELKAALAAYSNFPEAAYADGLALAHLNQDDAAKARFVQYLGMARDAGVLRQRAQRYAGDIALARARMAPPFEVTTLDGKQLSLDELAGKVVLIDFWATWCGPCLEALPHMKEIAKKFSGEPLVILSVSLDDDESKWKNFVAKNQMTWLQYRDGGFTGPVSREFDVHAIPHTFTIDADGIMQDEEIGDASIEGKLRKLCAEAKKRSEREVARAAAE